MQRFDLDKSLPSDLYNQHGSSWIRESFNDEDNDVFNNTWTCPPTKPNRRRYNSEFSKTNNYMPVQPVYHDYATFPFAELPRLPIDPYNPTMAISKDQLLPPAAFQGRHDIYDYEQLRPRAYSDSAYSRMAFSMGMEERMKFLQQPMQNSRFQRKMEISSMRITTFCEARKNRSRRSSRHNSVNSSDDECGYCRSIGYPSQGHSKYACPALASLSPCAICGAEGVDNHTASHCPNAEKELLQLKPDYLNQSLNRQRLRRNAVSTASSDSDA